KMQPAFAARREKRRELRRCRSGANVLVKERTKDPRPIRPWPNPSAVELLNDRIASRKEANEGAFGFVAIGRRKGTCASFNLRQKSGQCGLWADVGPVKAGSKAAHAIKERDASGQQLRSWVALGAEIEGSHDLLIAPVGGLGEIGGADQNPD